MKSILLSILVSLFASCTAVTIKGNIVNTSTQIDRPYLIKKSLQLKKAYQKLLSSPNTIKYEKEYFDTFPDSFRLLNSLFGYSDKDPMGSEFNPGPLYDKADLYISVFLKLKRVEKTQYFNRIIDLSINGKWYADGINYFQQGMNNKVNTNIELFSELLSKRKDVEIVSFWYFYFDSLYPVEKIPSELQKVKTLNGRIYGLMELALKKAQQAEAKYRKEP